MRRKFLSVVLCVCMMLTMVPFAFAAEGQLSSGGGSGSPTFDGLITTANALQNAINTATDNTTITVSGTIEISAPIIIDDTITITGTNNAEIKASNEFSGGYLIGLKTADKTLTLGNIKLNANEKSRVVYCNAGKVVVDGATITGGKTASSYIGGVYMTSNSEFEMNSGSITGNSVSSSYANDGYLQYSADLWIGANANGVLPKINGGTIGNVFINANEYSAINPGGFTMSNGTITNLYVEYDRTKNYGASFTYNDGSITNLYVGTKEGNDTKVKIDNPIAGMTYKGGQTSDDVLTPVAQVGTTTYGTLEAAIVAATDGRTVTLLKNATENVNISAGKSVAINLNGYTVTVPSDCGIELQGKLTVTGNGKITCANTPICVDGSSAELTVNDGTIESTNDYGIYAKNGGSVVVNGGTISSKNAALSGNNTTGSMNFTVNSGTLTAAQGPAIYMPGQVSLNISGGTLNGGVSLRMGQVNISGGTINAMTDVALIDLPQGQVNGKPAYTYSGNVWFPDALYVIGGTYTSENTTYYNSLNLNITGGTFNCANGKGSAVAIYDLAKVEQTASVEISGNAKFSTNASDRSAYQVLSLTDLGVENSAEGYNQENFVGKVSSSITGGYFTTDPTAYLATSKAAVESDLPGYNYKVADKSSAPATVASAAPTVDTDGLSTEQQAVATEIATKLDSNTVTGDGLTAAASTIANNNTVTTDQGKAALNSQNISAETSNTRIVVQTYMNINIKNIDTTSADKKTLSLDITPMYRTVATTANTDNAIKLTGDSVTDANAVPVGPAGKLTVSKPVIVKIPLPTNFATAGTSIYVQHKGYEYTAQVSEESSTLYATFTNPHGFSTFTITTEQTAEATLNGVNYTSFQDAVNAANNGDVITAMKDNLSATMSGSSRTITVKSSTGTFNVSVNGETKTADANTGVTFTYTRPSSGGPGSSGGSISAPTTYAVNVNAATNGAVAADKKTAAKGTTVTVTASPSKGYVVDAVKVVDKDGKDVAVTGKDGKYVFTMPGSAVTVTGSFKAETPAPAALPFTDVKSGDWFYPAVQYAYAQGLMTGTSATTFAPNGTMNRAMIVTVLYRLEKSPAVTGASKFTDVPAGQWYSDAVAWAAANKIVNGYDETTFGPMNAVTREQMAAILFRYEQVKGLENVTLEENLNRFPDQNKISAYAIPALQWAVGQKIINGNADGTLDPTGTATRAQVAQIFTNLLNQ